MKERPIDLSPDEVLGFISGRRTTLRRLLEPQPPSVAAVRGISGADFAIFRDAWGIRTRGEFRVAGPVWAVRQLMGGREPRWDAPYGMPGDRLWAREEFIAGWPCEAGEPLSHDEDGNMLPEHVWWRASRTARGWASDRGELIQEWVEDGSSLPAIPWRPAAEMPRDASRITLELASERVERLQEISEEGCESEGLDRERDGYEIDDVGSELKLVPAFANRWDLEHRSALSGWHANPWVRVLEVRAIEIREPRP